MSVDPRPSGMMQINPVLPALRVRGPFLGASGYDHHVREFVRELYRQGVEVELNDLPEWGPSRLPEALRDRWFESLGAPVDAGVGLHFCMPHQVTPFPGTASVNYTMFEATRIPAIWAEHSRSHDLIVLPTESSRRAWLAADVPAEQLRICPLGFNPELFGDWVEPLELHSALRGYRVRFLNVSELGLRKNLIGLLRAWLLATSSSDDAVLIVKLSPYSSDRLELFQAEVESLQCSLGKRLAEAAPIHVLSGLYADHQMPRLYAAATHYVSLSHGEGWDQAMMEAAASGLRLIAPAHSAYLTYLDERVARLVPSRELAAEFVDVDGLQTLFEGASWWLPDEEQAIAFLREAVSGNDLPLASAREHVRANFTWEQATRRLISILAEVTPRHKPRRRWPRLPWSSSS
jgi:glycosyltransferase involved in cell wall biosynthesis